MTRSVSMTLALTMALVIAAPARTENIVFPLDADAGAITRNDPILDLTQTWNGLDGGFPFTALKISVADNVSHATKSRLLEMRVNGGEVFAVRKSGELVISNPAGTSLGGLKLVGNLGEMALTSKLHPSTGLPADVFRYYWENGVVGEVAVIKGMGTNRLSLESNGSMVLIAKNSRYEMEGFGSPTINVVGYQAASANGRPINFMNEGQTAEHATPLYATNALSQVSTIQEWRDARSGAATTVAKVGADGTFTAKALILNDVPTSEPATAGAVWSDGGVLRLGGSSGPSQPVTYAWNGTAGGDAVLSSSGSGSLSIQSQAALILQSETGQMEFVAGAGLPRVNIVGHEDGSNLGVPINFTNDGQDAAQQSHALEVTNVHAGVTDIVRFNDGRGGSPVTVASVSADGAVTATALALTDLPTVDPAVAGEVWSDGGVLKLSGAAADPEPVSSYWAGAAGGDAVLSSSGSGDLSIESQAALILQSETGQVELAAGAGLPRVDIVGHEDGSNLGVPINFTNAGQDPAQLSHPLEVTNVHAGVSEIVRFNDARGGAPVTVAAVSADGQVMARGLTLSGVPTADPVIAGEVWADDGVLRLSGSSSDPEPLTYAWDGASGGDAVLSSAGSGSLSIASQAALVLQSGTGQMELEAGAGLPRVDIVGYENGSSLGVPVSFTNEGHDPAQKSHALEVTNVHPDIETIVEFRDGRATGTTAGATPVAAVGADGTLLAPTAILHNLPTSDPMVAGALWSDPADGLLRVSAGA